MKQSLERYLPLTLILVVLSQGSASADQAVLKGTYLLDDGFTAEEATASALVPMDPLGLNTFESATVFSQADRVYRLDGDVGLDARGAGLSLSTAGLIPVPNYSVEIIFEFLEENSNYGYLKILDVHNQQKDTGLYLYGGFLSLYDEVGCGWGCDIATGTTVVTTNQFHHVVFVNSPTRELNVYLDGVLEFTIPSTIAMRIATPEHQMKFFLDDVTTGGYERADARVARIRVFTGELTASEVADIVSQLPVSQLRLPTNDGGASSATRASTWGAIKARFGR